MSEYDVVSTEEFLKYNKEKHEYHIKHGYIGEKRPKVSKAKRKRVYQRDNGVCAYCKRRLSFEDFCIDHIIPLARGGNNEECNLTVSCMKCNLKKHTMTADEFKAVMKDG